MAKITFGGNEANTSGELPAVGTQLLDFELVATDLSEKRLSDFSGKRKILNIFPSIDTGVCQASARKFNEEATKLENTVVINIAKDLPFAMGRFCASEGLNNIDNLSDFRGGFGEKYGVTLLDIPLKGLLTRAVVVADENDKILYTELVAEIKDEPNYEKALSVLK